MRDVALLGTRLVVGSYLAVHGAQKLFGAFGGPGLDKAGAGFHRIGLRPGKHMATAATLAAVGPGKFRIGPSLPRPLVLVAAVGGGLLAAGLVARMLTATSV